jgi:hypothetical protein
MTGSCSNWFCFAIVQFPSDLSYARGFETIWEQFLYQIRNVSRQLPWMVTAGNHERDYPGSGSYYGGTDSGGECGVPYIHRFSMPQPSPNPDDYWYSLNHGPIHWVVLSTEHPWWEGTEQYAWMEQDLQSVDRSVTPFLFVAGHRPMLLDTTYPNMTTEATEFRNAVQPLLLKYKADAAFWGHHHSYQR